MKKINLKDYYPYYIQDTVVEVPDEVADLLREYKLSEAAHFLRTYRGDHRYSVVSDGSKVLCAAGAGHVAAICHLSGLYLAGV